MTYEYKCTKCARTFEQQRPVALRDAPTNCADCNGKCERKISTGTVPHFKGSGWADDGYRK